MKRLAATNQLVKSARREYVRAVVDLVKPAMRGYVKIFGRGPGHHVEISAVKHQSVKSA